MKFEAVKAFRAKLRANEPVAGLWVTLECVATLLQLDYRATHARTLFSYMYLHVRHYEYLTAAGAGRPARAPSITEAAVAFGLDYVVIDAEHGHLDWGVVLEHIRATVRSTTCAFVRLSENGNVDINASASLVKRALDIGADGVLVPCVETAEQCRVLVSQARYPFFEPEGGRRGIRGIGGERATVWGQNFTDHVAECAAEPPFVVPLLETHNGFLNREEIAAVEGIDWVQLGPADHSASKGFAG